MQHRPPIAARLPPLGSLLVRSLVCARARAFLCPPTLSLIPFSRPTRCSLSPPPLLRPPCAPFVFRCRPRHEGLPLFRRRTAHLLYRRGRRVPVPVPGSLRGLFFFVCVVCFASASVSVSQVSTRVGALLGDIASALSPGPHSSLVGAAVSSMSSLPSFGNSLSARR